MKKITGLNLQQVKQSRIYAISDDDKAMVKYVFGRFIGKLGISFASQLGDEYVAKLMTNEWAVGLKGLNVYDVNRGIDAMRGAFAPSLPDFIESCGKPKEHESHKKFLGLAKPIQDEKIVKDALTSMKESLK
jgi:hypothetical protein|nr:hypothetical protein [Rhodospirillales bacterium]